MALKLSVLDWNKKEVGNIEVPSTVLESPVRKDLIQSVVTWQLASRRQGTHSTLTRGLVRGGGKKPFKQKGTGNARQGSTRSPLNPGGGIILGPQPRDYSYSLPKKIKQAGLKAALSYLYKEGRFFVVQDMSSKEGKTKELSERLKKFGLNKALLIDSSENDLFKRASRNLKDYRFRNVNGLNVFDLLKYDGVIVTQSSVEQIVNRCGEKV